MFIKKIVVENKLSSGVKIKGVEENKNSSKFEFQFNITRLLVAAGLLIAILIFAIITAYSTQLNQIHTMLIHAFELILGLLTGLLGGEAIAKAEKD